MKDRVILHSLLFAILSFSGESFSGESFSQDEQPILQSPYLGKKQPDLVPRFFHPDTWGAFTPDLKEFYSLRFPKGKPALLMLTQYKNKKWNESIVMQGEGVEEPTISPDGKIMYMANKYMERTSAGWSELKSLGTLFEDVSIMRLSASAKDTYYFDEGTSVVGAIRYSRLIDGIHEEARALPEEVNTGKWIAHPFIAPDESYLIWDADRVNGYGDNDLYISFRQQDGSWGTGINMGDKINTASQENGGFLSPDGKYLFFNRHNSQGGMYWVDAKIIETLRPE